MEQNKSLDSDLSHNSNENSLLDSKITNNGTADQNEMSLDTISTMANDVIERINRLFDIKSNEE